MRAILLTYVAALVTMLAIDAVWLTLTAETLYRPALGDMMAKTFSPAPAVIFYLIYVAGLVALAVLPDRGASARSPAIAAQRGFIYGLCAYGTYDLTNQAVLRQWSTTLTLADMAWGSVLTAVVASVAALVYARFSVGTEAATARTR